MQGPLVYHMIAQPTWRVNIAVLFGKVYDSSIAENEDRWKSFSSWKRGTIILKYKYFDDDAISVWLISYQVALHKKKKEWNFQGTCSVKAKRSGEYISWPNVRRHFAPSPIWSILR